MIVKKLAQRDVYGEVSVADLGVDAKNIGQTESVDAVVSLDDEDSFLVAPKDGGAPTRIAYEKIVEALGGHYVSGAEKASLETLTLHTWRCWEIGAPTPGPLHYVQLGYDSDRSDISGTIYYADAIEVDVEAKTISLVDPQSVAFTYNTAYELAVLQGKYWLRSSSPAKVAYYSPEEATWTSAVSSSQYYVRMEAQAIVAAPRTGATKLLTSENRAEYPDSGILDGWEYEYMGVPVENARSAPKYAHGYYFGTGTSGADAPNQLVFDFEPKLVIINGLTIFVRGKTSGLVADTYERGGYYTAEWGENSLSWYAADYGWDSTGTNVSVTKPSLRSMLATLQLNTCGTQYHYFAMG